MKTEQRRRSLTRKTQSVISDSATTKRISLSKQYRKSVRSNCHLEESAHMVYMERDVNVNSLQLLLANPQFTTIFRLHILLHHVSV